MKQITKISLVLLATLILLASVYPLLGCCDSCGGCGGCCGSDDESEDTNDDGSLSQEQIPTTLGQTQERTTDTQRNPGVCDGITTNSISGTASKSGTQSGYTYSWSYTMKACASAFGFSVVLEGPVPKVYKQGVANKGVETSGSDSYSTTQSYTKLCIRTGDASIGNYCINFS